MSSTIKPTMAKPIHDRRKRDVGVYVAGADAVTVAKDAVLRAFNEATKKMPVSEFKVLARELASNFQLSADMAGVKQ